MPQNTSIRGAVWCSRYITEVGEKREEKEQAVKSFHWHVRKYRETMLGRENHTVHFGGKSSVLGGIFQSCCIVLGLSQSF